MTAQEKTIKLDAPFHEALQHIKDERGASKRFTVHIAIRQHMEMYYPHLIPVLTGGQIDEAKRPKPFYNKKGETNEHY